MYLAPIEYDFCMILNCIFCIIYCCIYYVCNNLVALLKFVQYVRIKKYFIKIRKQKTYQQKQYGHDENLHNYKLPIHVLHFKPWPHLQFATCHSLSRVLNKLIFSIDIILQSNEFQTECAL